MDKGIEALINKPIHQERRFQFIGKKQIEYWAEIDAGAYKYLPESERRIVYSELEVKTLISALEQTQQYAKKRDDENVDLMMTIGRLRVERERLEAEPNGMMQLSNELAEMKRKCAELTVWYGAMPESNGKTNWTAILHRKGECLSTGITIDRSEYPDRVRYEADRMSHLIGELTEEPDILAYDANKRSGYTARKEGECDGKQNQQ